MKEKFTKQALNALSLAEKAARTYGHSYIAGGYMKETFTKQPLNALSLAEKAARTYGHS